MTNNVRTNKNKNVAVDSSSHTPIHLGRRRQRNQLGNQFCSRSLLLRCFTGKKVLVVLVGTRIGHTYKSQHQQRAATVTDADQDGLIIVKRLFTCTWKVKTWTRAVQWLFSVFLRTIAPNRTSDVHRNLSRRRKEKITCCPCGALEADSPLQRVYYACAQLHIRAGKRIGNNYCKM